MIEMYPPAVSTKYVEDMGEALWEASVSTSTALNLNEKAFESVDRRLGSPLERVYPYVHGMYPKCAWGDAYKNVSIMDTIGINDNGTARSSVLSRALPNPQNAGANSCRNRSPRTCAACGCSPVTRLPAWSAHSRRCLPTRPISDAPSTSVVTCLPRSRSQSARSYRKTQGDTPPGALQGE